MCVCQLQRQQAEQEEREEEEEVRRQEEAERREREAALVKKQSEAERKKELVSHCLWALCTCFLSQGNVKAIFACSYKKHLSF